MQLYGVELIEDGDMVIRHVLEKEQPYESESMAAWIGACREHAYMIDVGAYTGLFTIVAAKRKTKAMAFEPNPLVYDRLRENVAANGISPDDVSCLRIALSDHNGEARFVDKPGTRLTSAGQIVDGHDVMRMRLDSFALLNVAAIKIDVEHHEMSVLRGAWQTIRRESPLIITEALTDDAFHEQRSFMIQLGYSGKLADGRNVIWRKR